MKQQGWDISERVTTWSLMIKGFFKKKKKKLAITFTNAKLLLPIQH